MSDVTGPIALEKWLRAQPGGYLHPGVKIASNEEAGVHWQAIQAMEPGTRLITVPHSVAFSYLNALADDRYPVFKNKKSSFKIEDIGFFYLALEYINRAKSFWKPYLDTLPQPTDTHTAPLWFDDPDDEAWLADTDALFTVKQKRDHHFQQYESGIKVLQAANIHTDDLTWDLFRWAIYMFSSRAFSSRAIAPTDSKYWTTYKTGPDGRRQTVLMDMTHVPAEDLDFPVLFPAIDAANHHHASRVDWSFDPGRFSLACTDGVEAGSEINNNYGPKGNDELLLGYGFCIPENPFDTVMLTLKPPPEDLQQTLRQTHAGYFDGTGQWSGDKATFRLRRRGMLTTEPTSIFDELPEPLLDLLTQFIRFDRGLPFKAIDDVPAYLKRANGYGRRYLPFIARMIVTSLAPKYQKLQAGSAALPSEPRNHRQAQAKIYRDSQLEILAATIAGLKQSLRIFRPPSDDFPAADITRLNPTGSRLVTLEEAIALLAKLPGLAESFLNGIKASANTVDVEQLRFAGWEEDIWVLLLCFTYLHTSAHAGDSVLSECMVSLDAEYAVSSLLSGEQDRVIGEASEEASDLMQIVSKAARKSPESAWADRRWSGKLIAGFGGLVLKNESFLMMVVDEDGRETPRLVVYLHA